VEAPVQDRVFGVRAADRSPTGLGLAW